jgi:methionyl-tRNA synthetase
MASMSDFQKLEMRIGSVKSVEDVEGADKLYKLKVDVGGETRQLVAGLKGIYSKEELSGRKIAVLTNLDPANIRGIESQGMLLAAQEGEKVVLLTTDRDIPDGARVC